MKHLYVFDSLLHIRSSIVSHQSDPVIPNIGITPSPFLPAVSEFLLGSNISRFSFHLRYPMTFWSWQRTYRTISTVQRDPTRLCYRMVVSPSPSEFTATAAERTAAFDVLVLTPVSFNLWNKYIPAFLTVNHTPGDDVTNKKQGIKLQKFVEQKQDLPGKMSLS